MKNEKNLEIILDFGTSHSIIGVFDKINLKNSLQLLQTNNIQNSLIDSAIYLNTNLDLTLNKSNAIYLFSNLKTKFMNQEDVFVDLVLETNDDLNYQFTTQINDFIAKTKNNFAQFWNMDVAKCLKVKIANNQAELHYIKLFRINDLLKMFIYLLKLECQSAFNTYINSISYAYPINLSIELRRVLSQILNDLDLYESFSLTEPEASLLCYDHDLKINQSYLVVDSGAGTTDFTLISKTNNSFLVIKAEYIALAGNDIDANIKQLWLDTYHTLPENVDDIVLNAKVFLNDENHINQTFSYYDEENKITYTLNYEQYLVCLQAFYDAYTSVLKTHFEHVNAVVLSGGSNLNLAILKYYKDNHYNLNYSHIYDAVIYGLYYARVLSLNHNFNLKHTFPTYLKVQYNNKSEVVFDLNQTPILISQKTFYNLTTDIKYFLGWTELDYDLNRNYTSDYKLIKLLEIPLKALNDNLCRIKVELDTDFNFNFTISSNHVKFKPLKIDTYSLINYDLVLLQHNQDIINQTFIDYEALSSYQFTLNLQKILQMNKMVENINNAQTSSKASKNATNKTAIIDATNDIFRRIKLWREAFNEFNRTLKTIKYIGAKQKYSADFLEKNKLAYEHLIALFNNTQAVINTFDDDMIADQTLVKGENHV